MPDKSEGRMIACQRRHFDIPDSLAYFNCAYFSPLSHAVRDAGMAGILRKSKPWQVKPHHFFDESERVRALFAEIIQARPGDIALIPSVSYGIGVAAANLSIRPGQEIVLLAEQFPSNVYPWKALAANRGAAVITVPRPGDGNWTPAILSAIGERTALLALPHCHWTDGSLVDLEEIGQACRERSIPLVLDLTQSLGAMPLNLEAVQPAFAVAAGYKWLLGPYSLGFLYAAPAYQEGLPLERNWITRAGSEDFAGLVNYTEDMVRDARRFDVGERSNFILLPMAEAAIRQILAWGVHNIAATLSAYNQRLIDRVESLGFQTIPKKYRAGHLVGLRYPDKLPRDLAATLAEEDVYVSVRGDAIRVAPHLYNDANDADRFIDTLKRVL